MDINKYFWNLNEKALKETKEILKNPQHQQFVSRVFTLLSRCDNPKEVFTVISRDRFINEWPRIRQYWMRTAQSPDFRAFWETAYEQLLEKERLKRKIHLGTSLKEFRIIGCRIKAERIRKGWTQSDFAKRTGVEQPDISAIEKGKKNITLETLIRLCRILSIKTIEI